MEHLPETEKHKQKSINPLQDFLGAAQDHVNNKPAIEGPDPSAAAASKSGASKTGGEKEGKKVPPRLTMEEYFTPPVNEKDYDGVNT